MYRFVTKNLDVAELTFVYFIDGFDNNDFVICLHCFVWKTSVVVLIIRNCPFRAAPLETIYSHRNNNLSKQNHENKYAANILQWFSPKKYTPVLDKIVGFRGVLLSRSPLINMIKDNGII